ncbi:hypothetical protein QZH41_002329 [Actinostola sp. cb2023]|nr:hypothetical protein QZH41_002329 [Actinostola sp. cb2023]
MEGKDMTHYDMYMYFKHNAIQLFQKRIYGYSEKTCYDFQLEYDDLFVRCGGGSGQYMALGQDNGSVCLWNMATPQTQVNFPVFQGAVDSISFHPTRPIVAFGGGLKSCVHLYSLS